MQASKGHSHSNQYGRKDLFQLATLRSYSITEENQGKNLRQEPGGTKWIRNHKGIMLTDLLILPFFIQFRTILLKVHSIHFGLDTPALFVNQRAALLAYPEDNLIDIFSVKVLLLKWLQPVSSWQKTGHQTWTHFIVIFIPCHDELREFTSL